MFEPTLVLSSLHFIIYNHAKNQSWKFTNKKGEGGVQAAIFGRQVRNYPWFSFKREVTTGKKKKKILFLKEHQPRQIFQNLKGLNVNKYRREYM